MSLLQRAGSWGPVKELALVVNNAVHRRLPGAYHDLEIALKKHKPEFLSLLKNPVSSSENIKNYILSTPPVSS